MSDSVHGLRLRHLGAIGIPSLIHPPCETSIPNRCSTLPSFKQLSSSFMAARHVPQHPACHPMRASATSISMFHEHGVHVPAVPLETISRVLPQQMCSSGCIENKERQRECANCGCTETPLWRRSPLGPKTVCNACGVRMKKGKLVFIESTKQFVTLSHPPCKYVHHNQQGNNGQSLRTMSIPCVNGNVTDKRIDKNRVVSKSSVRRSPQSIRLSAASVSPSSARSTGVRKGMERKHHDKCQGRSSSCSIGLYYLLAAIDQVENTRSQSRSTDCNRQFHYWNVECWP